MTTHIDLEATSDRLLTEVERQQKYLDRLPEDFTFPLFNAAQALESQRRSGYRNTASAAREIVDNAIEAGATRVDVCIERPKQLKAHQRAESVRAIAFIDNGSGMIPEMARYALSWGASTHFDDPAFIGKFGFGLPNASINQTRLVEVYTKTAGAAAITKATLDARRVKDHGLQTIQPTDEAELPDFVQAYLDKRGLPFEHGTVVVWVEPDRLTYRKATTMSEHLLDDFGVTYRHLLNKAEIVVEGKKVEPVDPLFLTPSARYFIEEAKGGAKMSADWNIPVKYALDPEAGQMTLSKVESMAELDTEDPNLFAAGAIYIRVSRFPYGFAEATDGKAETDAHRRFEIRKTRRGMSFVRAGREIETVDVFPKSMRDQSKGLGKWPLLQSYAYHWGVEVRFDPLLDEVFGITNDKQTVRPVEDLWRLLASEAVELDKQLGREQTFQRTMRRHEKQKKNADAQTSDTATLAESAAAAADSVIGQRPQVADRAKADVRQKFEAEAKRRAKVDQSSIDQARKALEDEAKKRAYVIDFYDEPKGPFYKPDWRNAGQVVVLINRQHAFFQTLYGPLLLTSQEVRDAYAKRYGGQVSVIASQMAGRAITKPADLKVLTTTSLYGVGSSQYNRLALRSAEHPSLEHDIRWDTIGKSLTGGFGTLHLSAETANALRSMAMARHDARRVNNRFGEGTSPRMRQIREGLDALGLKSDAILHHATPRIFYGCELFPGARASLMGLGAATAAAPAAADVAAGWRRRWLTGRVRRPETLEALGRLGAFSISAVLHADIDGQFMLPIELS